MTVESLESRWLMATDGPKLLGARADLGDLLTVGSVGLVRSAPNELRLLFQGGAEIDPTTLATGIRLQRSGFDDNFNNGAVTVTPAYLRLGDDGTNQNEVVMRFGSTLPDDLYRLDVFAQNIPFTAFSALADVDGNPLEPAVTGADRDRIEFDLDLGAQVIAVVPQPVSRTSGGALQQAGDTIVVHLNNDDLDPVLAGSPSFYRLVDTRGTLTPADDRLHLAAAATYSASTDTVTLRFDDDNNLATAYTLPAGTWRLDVGVSDEPNNLTGNAIRVGAVYNGTPYNTLSYLGDGDGTSSQASDVDLFRVSLRAGATATVVVTPTFAGLDVDVRLLRADGTTVVAPTVNVGGTAGIVETRFFPVPATEDYFVEVRGVGGTTGGYQLSVSQNAVLTLGESGATPDDDDSSFPAANVLGVLGDGGFSINAAITPPTLPLPQYPGGNDEPGHRDITPDGHSGTYGLDLVPSDGIEVQYYNFALFDPNNRDPSNNPYPNQITDEEKQLVRDIYEIYASLTGIQFVEDTVGLAGTRIMVGDLRAADPSSSNGPGGVAGLGGGSIVVLDALEGWGLDRKFGSGFFQVMLHEIGHALGLEHSYDVPSTMGGDFTAEPVYPGDADVMHLNRLYRPDNIDVDMYRFDVQETGRFTAEILAERATAFSALDSVLRLYRQNPDGTRVLIAQNDDFYSDDSFVEMALTPGTYFVGVSSVGNEQYNPEVLNSGFGGRTQGAYNLRLNFLADPARSLTDTTDTPIDGDADGVAGGQFQFWFQTGVTRFVDKMADTIANVPQGNGSLATPHDTIAGALAAAAPGEIVRIVGNGGTDGNLSTVNNNRPYLIGYSNSNNPLPDGADFEVPQGVTVMIDAGAILKLRLANVDVGTSQIADNRANGALQVLGTPTMPVYFRSLRDDSIGGDSDGTSPAAAAGGDWGGLVFRDDSDRETAGVFLNWVSHADLRHGGGTVFVGTDQDVYTPIHLESARPTLVRNTIQFSNDAAISADPNSFADQIPGNTDKRLKRFGPDIYGNALGGSTVNGLFVRIDTALGQPIDKLDVTARFDDHDIVHVITENLLITGNAGGAVDSGTGPQARTAGRLMVDPGVIVKLGNARIEAERGSAQVIAEGTPDEPVRFTSVRDDRYGAGGTFDTNGDGASSVGSRGDWGGFLFNHTTRGSFDYASIAFAGGDTPIEGGFANFAPIEVQQATLRLTNSLLEDNGDGADGSNRNGRMGNVGSTIFVRGAQPVIVNNVIQDNEGPAIHINVNSLDAVNRKDYGRSTGPIDAFTQFNDNYGPLVRLNRMDGNATNGMEVRADELTTESIWDDTDIVHVVRGEIEVATSQNHHTYSGLRLKSSVDESLVVKLDGDAAGFTVDGELHELDDRIGGAIHVLGTVGHPVILTALSDCSVGAGFTPDGQPQKDTVAGGTCGTTVVTTTPGFADVLVVIDESGSMGLLQDFTEQMIPALEAALVGAGIGDGTIGTNNYGLVGYGGASATARGRSLTVGSGLWGNSVEYVTAAQNLQTVAGGADGYRGLDFALANYSFRGSAAKFIILITDTNREAFGAGGLSPSTPASLLGQLNARDITLQTIVDARFRDGANATAVAVDANRTAYLADGLGGYTSTTGGFVFFAQQFIERDYINLGWATGGISGDLNPIAAGGDEQVTFTQVFADSIVDQAQAPAGSQPGEWRSIRLDQYSNDRNVEAAYELEAPRLQGADINRTPAAAQTLGVLAPNEKSGDENRRLGFEVLGHIAYDDPADRDVYMFTGTVGTRIWVDIDRTDSALDTRVELVDFAGNVIAASDDSVNDATLTGTAQRMRQNVFLSEDNYTLNRKDAGFSVVLPGSTPGQTGTFFVRVSSDGRTTGHYQLQIRMRQQDEEPGSAIRQADIRNATTGIEVIGLPARSNLAGEAGENGDASGAVAGAQSLGNLMQSDRNTVSVAGNLGSGVDVDWYSVDVTMAQIQSIPGVNDDTTIQWPLVFDVDYADGLTRPDSTLSVFDETGRLILIGRESSVADDQPVGASLSLDDLSRGTVGRLDPFIGPVIVNEGTSYRVAVTSNQQMSNQLQQFSNAAAPNPLTRLEPLESVTRVVEDHIGTSGYVTSNVSPVAPTTSIFDIDTVFTLDTHIVNFTLDDVRLYVSTETQLFSLDAESANNVVTVGTAGTTNNRLQDIVIRSDGLLFGYRDNDTDTLPGDNDVGNTAGTLVNYNPGNAAVITAVNDGIRGPVDNQAFTPNNSNNGGANARDVTYTDGVEALTFRRNSLVNADTVDYDVFYSVNDPLAGATPGGGGYSKLFLDPDGPRPDGAVNLGDPNRGFVGYIGGAIRAEQTQAINGASITFISARPGLNAFLNVVQNAGNSGGSAGNGIDVQVAGNVITVTVFNDNGNRSLNAQQLVDAINANPATRVVGIAQLNNNPGNRISRAADDNPPNALVTQNWSAFGGSVGAINGRTTGMAFLGGVLYGVSDRGEFFRINTTDAATNPIVDFGPGVSFQGLALGPQNIDENRDGTPDYANFLFAIDANGTLRALSTAGVLQPVFNGNTTLATGVANPTGLAFSNLDFNLWHPTTRFGNEAGHGINGTFNGSRPEVAGGTSFYFGLEQADAGYLTYDVLNTGADGQYGVLDVVHRDLSTNPALRNTYDLPGGAKGTLLADSFSLSGYTRHEKPTLYFNYFLQTQGAGGGDGAMRDSARVFISRDGGTTWELVASNNSARAEGNELPQSYTHDSTSNPAADPAPGDDPNLLTRADIIAQQVQELFDTAQWRQARVDLSAYAGESNLRLRFDFATAGAIDEVGLPGERFGALGSAERGQANNFAGFYVDDIIVGFSERGELVTAAQVGATQMVATNAIPEPAPQPQLAGPYQLEIRPGADYGGNTVTYNAPGINRIFDTNDRLVQEDAATGVTPTDNFNRTALRTTTSLPWQTGGFSDWTIVANRANGNLSTVGVFDPNDLAASEFTVLQISLETGAGNVSFTEFSTFADAAFFIDGVNVDGVFAGAPFTNGAQQYFVEAGLHTFTWVGLKFTTFGVESTAIDNFSAPAAIVGTGDKGDDNFFREQGQLILRDNKITNSLNYGIEVTAAGREQSQNMPRPGVPINFNTLNANRWVPGVVIENNVLANNQDAAIRFGGDNTGNPLAVVPYGRIVNNTIFGGLNPNGIGIEVTNNASPTILNNIFANTDGAITTTGAGQVVIGSNLFHNNAFPTVDTHPVAGSSPLFSTDTDPLFTSTSNGMFYLAPGALAIDSSAAGLGDRAGMLTIKTPLGIPASNIVAPDFDVYGQRRVDDPLADPLGAGPAVFKDRGAVESADTVGPYARLIGPVDDDAQDADPNETVVLRRSGILSEFAILLADGIGSPFPNSGTGVDPDTVRNSTSGLSTTVVVKRDGVTLEQNVDYTLGYNENNQTLLLTPLSEVWEPNRVYEIELLNQDAFNSIRDFAGNRLRGNQTNGTNKFTIILGDLTLDYGDASPTIGVNPSTFPTLLADDGARHVQTLGSTLFLGALLDTEDDGVPTVLADGDDFPFTLTVVSSGIVTTGNSLQLPAAAGLTDGDTITINDGVNTPTVLEFNLTGGLANGAAIGLPIAGSENAVDVAKLVQSAVQSRIDSGFLENVRPRRSGDTVTLTQLSVDDEDGVDFTGTVFNENTDLTDFSVTSTGAGFLDAWVDFNNDGAYAASEQILNGVAVTAGANDFSLSNITPAGSFIGFVNARFRLSSVPGGVTPGGLTIGGEVEDYLVEIRPGTPPVAVADAYDVDEDTTLTVPADGVLANDTDADLLADPVGAWLVTGPTNAAAFVLNPDGSFSYTPDPEFYGQDTFVYRAVDSDDLLSNNHLTVTITVHPVNDPPVITAPDALLNPQVTDEDVPLTFSATTSPTPNPIVIADDAGAAVIQVALSAPDGRLTLSSLTGLDFSFSDGDGTGTGDGTDDTALVFRGTPADVNAALEGLVFRPNDDFHGDAVVTIVVNDLGATGVGGPQSDIETVTVTVNSINDAPEIGAPASLLFDEDTVLTFSAGNGNALTVWDDSGAALIQTTIQVTQGRLTLGSFTGLTFLLNDGVSDGTVMFNSTLADLNAALEGLRFVPNSNFNGNASLELFVNDQGASGAGVQRTSSMVVPLTVRAVNDAPVNSVPAAQTVAEDSSLTFSSALGRQISVSDVDTVGSIRVTLTGANGVISLNGTAGLTFQTGDGTADPTMTFTGTIATINARLNGLVFTPNLNFDGAASITIVSNDLGQVGSGGELTDTDVVPITVTPVNDAPVNQFPAFQITNEDVGIPLGVSVQDDAGVNPVRVALNVVNAAHGVIAFSSLAGVTIVAGANSTSAVTIEGPLTLVNGALATAGVIPALNYNGALHVAISTSDLGNTGAGGVRTDVDTLTISVTAVNDAPVNTVPGTQVTDDEVPIVFSTGAGNAISIADVDAGAGSVRVSLTAVDGRITLPSVTGLAFTVGDGTDDANMSFTGTVATINARLNGLSFRPNDFFVGTAQLVITTNDLGLTGVGGQQIDTDTVSITVNSVNDPPVNRLPPTQTVAEDGTLAFTTAGGNAISVIDDALLNDIEVRLTAVGGVLTLGSTSGVTLVTNDGVDDGTFTVRGPFAAINTALDGLLFKPTPDFNGTATIAVRSDDLGNSGAGAGPLVTTSTLTVTVTPVNDAPVNTLPPTQTMNEDTLLTLTGATRISVLDVDATQLEITLSVDGGTIDLSGVAGLTFTAGDGVGDSLATFRGAPAAVNTALDGLRFSPANGTSGAATIAVTSSDLGGTGSGGVRTDADTLTITVNPVNDAPTHVLPSGVTTPEDQTLTLSTGGGNAVTVVDDAGTSPVRMTVAAVNGQFALTNLTGLTFAFGDGSFANTMTFSGTLTNLNAALNGLLFRPAANFVGNATLAFTTEDLGATGAGGPLTGTDTLTISVTAVNDAPVNTVPGAQSTPEDVSLVFSSGLGNQISIADVDAGSSNVRLQLTATNGSLTLFATAGLTFTTGDGTDDSTMTFTGTLASINAALNGMSFRSAANYFGAAGLQLVTNDLGATGAGTAQTASSSIAITVTSVNDAPIPSPLPRSTSEDTPLTVSATTLIGNDVPGPTNEAGQTLTLTSVSANSANNGTVTLNAGQVVYTPALNFNGQDTFTYLITDNGTTNGVAEPKSAFGTVTVTVQPQNDAPLAVNDSYVMNEDTTLTRSAFNGVITNDSDPENSPLTATRVSGPTVGTLNLATNGGFTYIPPANFFGNATFTYRVSDGSLNSNVATVTITVQDVNEPPIANADSASTTLAQPVTISVLANDTDVDGSLAAGSVQIASNPTNGAVVVNGDGTVTYTPTTGFQGVDTFQYTVRDNVNDVSNVATVTVNVGPAPPIWQNQTNNLDVNGDAFIAPNDPLLIINELNLNGSYQLPVGGPVTFFYDVNGDGFIAPDDALAPIIFLNEQSNSEAGEGEAAEGLTQEPAAGSGESDVYLAIGSGWPAGLRIPTVPAASGAANSPAAAASDADPLDDVALVDDEAAAVDGAFEDELFDELLGEVESEEAAELNDAALLELWGG